MKACSFLRVSFYKKKEIKKMNETKIKETDISIQDQSSKDTSLKKNETLFILENFEGYTSHFMVPNIEFHVESLSHLGGEIKSTIDSYQQRKDTQKYFGIGLDSKFISTYDNNEHLFRNQDCIFCKTNGPLESLDNVSLLYHYLEGMNLLEECLYEKYRVDHTFKIDPTQPCISITFY